MAVSGKCSSDQVFLKFSQISQEKSSVGVSFQENYLSEKVCNFIKKRLQHRCFPVKFSKFLRKFFSTEHLWWLLLKSNLLQIMSNFLFETCGFTNNPNFLLFKWRLKRKHSPAKCVIRATEIRPMEIRLHGGQMAKWPL